MQGGNKPQETVRNGARMGFQQEEFQEVHYTRY